MMKTEIFPIRGLELGYIFAYDFLGMRDYRHSAGWVHWFMHCTWIFGVCHFAVLVSCF